MLTNYVRLFHNKCYFREQSEVWQLLFWVLWNALIKYNTIVENSEKEENWGNNNGLALPLHQWIVHRKCTWSRLIGDILLKLDGLKMIDHSYLPFQRRKRISGIFVGCKNWMSFFLWNIPHHYIAFAKNRVDINDLSNLKTLITFSTMPTNLKGSYYQTSW